MKKNKFQLSDVSNGITNDFVLPRSLIGLEH